MSNKSQDSENDPPKINRSILYEAEPIKSEKARKSLQDLMKELGGNAEAERRQRFSYRFKSFLRRHLRWCKAKS